MATLLEIVAKHGWGTPCQQTTKEKTLFVPAKKLDTGEIEGIQGEDKFPARFKSDVDCWQLAEQSQKLYGWLVEDDYQDDVFHTVFTRKDHPPTKHAIRHKAIDVQYPVQARRVKKERPAPDRAESAEIPRGGDRATDMLSAGARQSQDQQANDLRT